MRFFWPNKLNPSPSVLTRFGRVVHWIATAGFLFFFITGAIYLGFGGYQYATNAGWYFRGDFSPYWPSSVGVGLGGVVFGLIVYFAGRAFRYILSGE